MAKLNDSQKKKLIETAKIRGGSSQQELAVQLGISVNTLRKALKDSGEKWKGKTVRVKRKTITNNNSNDIRKNNLYHNPKSNSIKSPWGNGNLSIR